MRCTKLVRDVLPKAGKEAPGSLLPFLQKVLGVQDLQQANVLAFEEVLGRLESAGTAAAAYSIIKNPSPQS
jgi:hypothetical protein